MGDFDPPFAKTLNFLDFVMVWWRSGGGQENLTIEECGFKSVATPPPSPIVILLGKPLGTNMVLTPIEINISPLMFRHIFENR